MKKPNLSRIVSETDLGVYVWQFPDGTFFADSEMNVLSITARRNDLSAMSKLSTAAKHYGATEGTPVFLEGKRKISDAELQEQIDRMKGGFVPDPLDIGVYKDWKNGNRR